MLAMHIPDGFLDGPTSLVAAVIALAGVTWCLRRTSSTLDEREIPVVGLAAAFVFAAQMLNFPVANGTSGHFFGGVLAAVLVGPFAGALAVTVVLAVQALLFADGGLTALGLNVINMALVGSVAGLQYLLVFAGGGSIALLTILQAASVVGAVGAVATSAYAGLAWRSRWWGRLGTAHYTAEAAALVTLLVFAYHYGLLYSAGLAAP